MRLRFITHLFFVNLEMDVELHGWGTPGHVTKVHSSREGFVFQVNLFLFFFFCGVIIAHFFLLSGLSMR